MLWRQEVTGKEKEQENKVVGALYLGVNGKRMLGNGTQQDTKFPSFDSSCSSVECCVGMGHFLYPGVR